MKIPSLRHYIVAKFLLINAFILVNAKELATGRTQACDLLLAYGKLIFLFIK